MYHDTQFPLAAPSRAPLTAGEALMNTSPWRVPPLIPLAIASDPMEVSLSVYPVAFWKAGPICCCSRSCNEPADSTSTGPEGKGDAAAERGTSAGPRRDRATLRAAIQRGRMAPDLRLEYQVSMPTR